MTGLTRALTSSVGAGRCTLCAATALTAEELRKVQLRKVQLQQVMLERLCCACLLDHTWLGPVGDSAVQLPPYLQGLQILKEDVR